MSNDLYKVLEDLEKFFGEKKTDNKWKPKRCFDPGHGFPSHLYIPPGECYEHTCPSCGHVSRAWGRDISYVVNH